MSKQRSSNRNLTVEEGRFVWAVLANTQWYGHQAAFVAGIMEKLPRPPEPKEGES